MENKGLVKKISKCLGILAFSTLIGSGICYSKETNPQGYEIPDLSQASFHGTVYKDMTDKIDGPETRFDGYILENPKRGVYKISINDKVFLYNIGYYENNETYGIADLDGDGIFETKYNTEELRKKGESPAKEDLPPEWVLK
jgi:hypothetical protein